MLAMQQITPSQIPDWVRQARSVDAPLPVVLDVREPWELQTAAVQGDAQSNGFELMAMPMRTVPARHLELDRHRPIACLCHHGARSAQVAHFLMQQGFTQVVNVQGGIHAWALELDPRVPVY
jgi:rhodanese-related sulfurtransferase